MSRSLFVVLLALPALCQPVHVSLDPTQTKVNFTLGDVLHTVHGVFKLTKGDLWIDPATGKASGVVVVDATSGDSGSHTRDGKMNKNVLEASRFPEITFTPDRLEGPVNLAGDSNFQLHGIFAIHGSSNELTFDIKSHISGDQVTAVVNFDVPYVKWGMKNPSTLFLRVNENVQIEVQGAGLIDHKTPQ